MRKPRLMDEIDRREVLTRTEAEHRPAVGHDTPKARATWCARRAYACVRGSVIAGDHMYAYVSFTVNTGPHFATNSKGKYVCIHICSEGTYSVVSSAVCVCVAYIMHMRMHIYCTICMKCT